MIVGNADENGDEIKVTVDDIYPIEKLHERNASNILILINKKEFDIKNLQLVKNEVEKHPGTCRLGFRVIDNGHTKDYLSKEFKVNPKQELISNLKKILGESNLKIN